MTNAAPLLILAAAVALTWFCCLRPMRTGGRRSCPPTQDRSAEMEALRREIPEGRRSPE